MFHELPVPASGDCSGTGAHLDPYGRTESPPCDIASPATCQLGDLSGKHGNITTTTNFQTFSTQPGALSFFGNRSVVVHNSAGARINCGNFTNVGKMAASATASTATALPTGVSMSASSAAATKTSGSAAASATKNAAPGMAAEQGSWLAGAVVAVLAAL